MATFDHSRYNQSKYNVVSESQTTWDSITMAAIWDASVGISQQVRDEISMSSSFGAGVIGAAGRMSDDTMGAVFVVDVVLNYCVWDAASCASVFGAGAYVAPSVKSSDILDCVFDASAYLGAVVSDSVVMGSEFETSAYAGNYVIDAAGANLYAMFGAFISINSYEEFVAVLDVTIPAKGELIIDSENFRVLLNKVNAISSHSGDWIRALSRESIELRVDCGTTNNLETSLLYTELWL